MALKTKFRAVHFNQRGPVRQQLLADIYPMIPRENRAMKSFSIPLSFGIRGDGNKATLLPHHPLKCLPPANISA